ncbi:toxin glutamine deamidase domain-containing protein [Mycolicibacterium sp. HK-90]|uniref:toxin glutamine deamidase domain-containing protein n=1 Tax=Mycolicibacterium sp. HK-90 TaxID=3056937 RepID=UPI0026587C62|nr:toxin glutamine deamidase domain-containing protein [Mycolicibacterium sp. HK-90]WKG03650.1 toxin glutamine deamidase domain-containing protein [Mycolicibacterium sp. HK-90]
MTASDGRFEVDPDALIRNGRELGSLGTQLGMLSDSLGAALSGGIASGLDPAGLNFGLTYADLAQNFANYLADAANALKSQGYMLEATGFNYKNADAASTVGGPGPAGGVGEVPATTAAADAPLGPNGTFVPPPPGWAIVEALVRLPWPSGVPALMSLNAAQWKNYANGFVAVQASVDRAKASVALDVQHLAEGPKINEALQTLGDKVSHLAKLAKETATKIEEFAKGVQEAQDAIRRILDRMSLSGVIDTVKGIFTGDGARIVREIAHDARAVLNYLQSIVKAIVGVLGQLIEEIGDAATALQEWVKPRLEQVFGEEVGGALFTAFKTYTDFQVGVVSGVIGTVAGVVAMADPDTWIGMYDVAMMVVQDPSKADDVLVAMGKEFVAWDKWSGDHPGRAAGEAGFNILSSFAPGGPLSKAGLAAKGMRAAKGAMAADGKLSKLGDLTRLGSGKGKLEGLDSPGPSKAPELPEFAPTPGIPESVIGSKGPNDFGAPVSRPGPDGHVGSPESSAPRGYHGGGGDDPPDPPGRATGPSESVPAHSSGPSPQSPSSTGPGHPVDSPHSPGSSTPNHSPSSGGPVTPSVTHAPESSGPAYTPDSSQSQSGNGQTPATHEPSAPESRQSADGASRPDHGSAPHSPDRAGDGQAPNANHDPNSGEHSGRADERANTPADQLPAQTPSAEHPASPERTATDGASPGEQSQPPGDSHTGRPDSGVTPAGMMPMVGGPIASHAQGPVHGPVDSQGSSAKPQTSDPASRNSDAKTPHTTSPDNTRAQSAAATGPAPGNTPTAPVKSTTGETATGGPNRPGSEATTPRPGDTTRDDAPPHDREPHKTSTDDTTDKPSDQPDPPPSEQDAGAGTGSNSEVSDRSGPVGNPADERVFGPHELGRVENPAYQSAVEHALRTSGGEYSAHADPRTNDYGRLINDGGPEVPGRSNNCLDCSLSALSSFRGDPTVSAPRYPDRLPDGSIDKWSGEKSGLRRAAGWLGGGLLEFNLPGQPLASHFDAIHQYVDKMGPGSAALVVNGWHGRNLETGEFEFHQDGSPVTRGSHATVVVYPEGADGPVWWDPQQGLTSDTPPSWMVDESSYVHLTPIESSQGVAHDGGTGNQGTSAGVSGTDVADRDVSRSAVQERVGGHESLDSGTDEFGSGSGVSPSGDRFGDGDRVSVSELVGDDGGGSSHNIQADGRQEGGSADLPTSVEDHGSAGTGGRTDDRVSDDGGVAEQSSRADTTTSVDDRETHLRPRSDGLVVEHGDVERRVAEPTEPRNLAGSGDDGGLADRDHAASSAPHPAATHEYPKPDHEDRSSDEVERSSSDGHDDYDPGHRDPEKQSAEPNSRPEGYDTSGVEAGDAPAAHAPDRYIDLDDGTQHRVWASSEHLRAQQSRFEVADQWLSERGLTRDDVQSLLVQPADWLNGAQRELIYGFRHQFPDVTASGESLQKVIDTGQAEGRLSDGPKRYPADETGGSVSVARDTSGLDTPERIYDGLALGYDDTPFTPDKPVAAMRFTVDEDIPIHVPDGQLSERAGHGPGFDPGYDYPFTGTGFTASDRHTVPEYFLPGETRMNSGAEMYRIDTDGSEELLAVLNPDGDWVPVRQDGSPGPAPGDDMAPTHPPNPGHDSRSSGQESPSDGVSAGGSSHSRESDWMVRPDGRDPSGSGTRGWHGDLGGSDSPPENGNVSHESPGTDAIGPDNRYKLSGHGDYYAENGVFRVPENTTITTYAEHGSPITTALGNLIESGGDRSRVYSQTFYPGEEIPNYTLYPPDDLNVVGTPHTVDRATLLSDLLRPNMGNVDFAACLGYTSDKVFDVDMIYDPTTFQPIQTYERPVIYVDDDDDW